MDIKIANITGVDDAIISMYMSKRSWSPELDREIRTRVDRNTFSDGTFFAFPEKAFLDDVEKVLKYGIDYKHVTLLRFIDISVVTEGLHRGAQDDFDSHAKRLDNRIVRASTRLSKFGKEKSDWYKGKILTTDEALWDAHMIPKEVVVDGKLYTKCTNGYVLKELAEDKDVLRGLYNLSIPSDFIWKCQYPEFGHIYHLRNEKTSAAPELREMVELVRDKLTEMAPPLGQRLADIDFI